MISGIFASECNIGRYYKLCIFFDQNHELGYDQNMKFEVLTGRTDEHLVNLEHGQRIHKSCYDDFFRLKGTLSSKKIDMRSASSFRSYERQRTIWNEKAEGKRILRDINGNPLNYDELNCEEIFWAILNWSSIPGTSRHHWGTDLDVYDHSKYLNGERLRLINSEYQGEGPNAKLSEELFKNTDLFYRPYLDGKSYQMELWHMSHVKISKEFSDKYTIDVFKKSVSEDPKLLLKEHIIKNIDFLYKKYIALKGA